MAVKRTFSCRVAAKKGTAMKTLQAQLRQFTKERSKRKKLIHIVGMLSVAVAVCVFWQLKLTGITMTEDALCGQEAHIHTEACVEEVLVCELQESTESADDDVADHSHSEECYDENGVLICGESENNADNTVEQHIHDSGCYEETYICGLEEHTHSALCFSDTSDVEDQNQWTADFPALTGEWPSDVAAIAKSQVGYTEKESNFTLADDGETRKGYTRYADWYFGEANPYADWNTAFAAFCLHYAGVTENAFPINSGADAWLTQICQLELFTDCTENIPKSGDLLFIDSDWNGVADRVGIVIYADGNCIETVEGDYADAVAQTTYAPSDPSLVGYGSVNQAYNSYLGIETEADEEEPDSIADTEYEEDGFAIMLANDEVNGAPDYIGTVSTSNQWQIVAEQYAGNSNSNKISYDTDGDGCADVLLQKNVVPTENENEFLVYLGITKQMSWDELLAQSTLGLTTQGKWSESDVGSLVSTNAIGGNKTNILQPGYSSGGRNYEATIYLQRGGTTVHTYVGWYNGTTPNASNCTGYIILKGLDNKAIIASVSVNLHQDGSGSGGELSYTIDLDKMSNNGIFYAVEEISLDSVTDVLGNGVVYDGVVNCDGTVSYDNGALTWNIAENETVTGINYTNPVTGYIENVAQLVYKVKLDVTQDGFHSCADNMNSSVGDAESYAVNRYATLNYHLGSQAYTRDFPVPYVRGLLYDITFEKKGDDGKYLNGAVFGIYEADGVTPIYQNGTPYTITTDKATTINAFLNLPCGDYVIREIEAPKGYSAPDPAEWNITLCYTDNSSQLEQDSFFDEKNMRYTGNDSDGVWTIINSKNPFTYSILVIKQDKDGNSLSNVPFSLTPDVEGIWSECSTDGNGQYLFDSDFGLNVSFELTEIAPPDGYFGLPSTIQFKVLEDEDTGAHSAVLLNEDQLENLVSLNLIEDDETGENQLQITIINETGYVLPETGGSGIFCYTLSGTLIIAAALMYRYGLRRKRERRSKT